MSFTTDKEMTGVLRLGPRLILLTDLLMANLTFRFMSWCGRAASSRCLMEYTACRSLILSAGNWSRPDRSLHRICRGHARDGVCRPRVGLGLPRTRCQTIARAWHGLVE